MKIGLFINSTIKNVGNCGIETGSLSVSTVILFKALGYRASYDVQVDLICSHTAIVLQIFNVSNQPSLLTACFKPIERGSVLKVSMTVRSRV